MENIKNYLNKRKEENLEKSLEILENEYLDNTHYDNKNFNNLVENKLFFTKTESEQKDVLRIFKKFKMFKRIKNLEYLFEIQAHKNIYKNNYKKEDFISYATFITKYGFAKTNLKKEDLDILFQTINIFFNNIYMLDNGIKEVYITPSSYEKDIDYLENKIKKIIENDKNYKREDFFDNKGQINIYKLDSVYEDLFEVKKNIELEKGMNSKKIALKREAEIKRKRLFKEYLATYLVG